MYYIIVCKTASKASPWSPRATLVPCSVRRKECSVGCEESTSSAGGAPIIVIIILLMQQCIYIYIYIYIYAYVYIYIYIYIYTAGRVVPRVLLHDGGVRGDGLREDRGELDDVERQVVVLLRMALLVSRYLSHAASFILCALRSVKDHPNLPHYSPLLKKTRVRKAVPAELLRARALANHVDGVPELVGQALGLPHISSST